MDSFLSCRQYKKNTDTPKHVVLLEFHLKSWRSPFYSHFALQPKGKYIIKICDGTACHVKKSTEIINALEKHLGLTAGRRTTEDLLFTIETVACLGTCGLAPAIVINDEVHGLLTPEKAVELVKQIQAKEANSSGDKE